MTRPLRIIVGPNDPNPPSSYTITQANFLQYNRFQQPWGRSMDVLLPRVDSTPDELSLCIHNSDPNTTLRLVLPENPINGTIHSDGHKYDTICGCPYEAFLKGDQFVELLKDRDSNQSWIIRGAKPGIIQIPETVAFDGQFHGSGTSWASTGIWNTLKQKLFNRTSIERVEVNIGVGASTPGLVVALTLWDGVKRDANYNPIFEHLPTTTGLAVINILDPYTCYPVTLKARRQGTITGGLVPDCNPAFWTVYAKVISGPAGADYWVGRSAAGFSTTQAPLVTTVFDIEEWSIAA